MLGVCSPGSASPLSIVWLAIGTPPHFVLLVCCLLLYAALSMLLVCCLRLYPAHSAVCVQYVFTLCVLCCLSAVRFCVLPPSVYQHAVCLCMLPMPVFVCIYILQILLSVCGLLLHSADSAVSLRSASAFLQILLLVCGLLLHSTDSAVSLRSASAVCRFCGLLLRSAGSAVCFCILLILLLVCGPREPSCKRVCGLPCVSVVIQLSASPLSATGLRLCLCSAILLCLLCCCCMLHCCYLIITLCVLWLRVDCSGVCY